MGTGGRDAQHTTTGQGRARRALVDVPVAEHRGGAQSSSAVCQRASRAVRSGDGEALEVT